MDAISKNARSNVMRSVKSRGNKTTEMRLRAALISYGIRGWVLHDKRVPGCPDFVFNVEKIAIFVDGCFWHACPRCYRRPKSSKKYWDEKAQRNSKRDKLVAKFLRANGWRVLRIWEHSLNDLGLIVSRIVELRQAR